MELLNVRQLGPMLKDAGVFSQESQALIDRTMSEMAANGKRAAIGDIAVELGVKNELTGQPFSKDDLNRYLSEQLVQKAGAIAKDIGVLAKNGPPDESLPAWLKANWGNNGVNPASESPTREDGLSAVVNMAQNMLMAVVQYGKENPASAQQLAADLKPYFSAAARLAEGILDGDSRAAPIAEKGEELMDTLKSGLRLTVERTGVEPLMDNWGKKEVPLGEYIANRFTEIKAGVNIALEVQQRSRETETQI